MFSERRRSKMAKARTAKQRAASRRNLVIARQKRVYHKAIGTYSPHSRRATYLAEQRAYYGKHGHKRAAIKRRTVKTAKFAGKAALIGVVTIGPVATAQVAYHTAKLPHRTARAGYHYSKGFHRGFSQSMARQSAARRNMARAGGTRIERLHPPKAITGRRIRSYV